MVNSCSTPTSMVKADVELRWSGRMLLKVQQVNGIHVPHGAAK